MTTAEPSSRLAARRRPLLANLWMLKAGNGMLWYAIDYLRRLDRPVQVVVRPPLAGLLRRELDLPSIRVEAVGPGGFLRRVLAAAARGEPIYAPTPHPIPFVRRQMIVFHDPYPFDGPQGETKRRLLRFGLATSRCTVGYINRSTARPWLVDLGVPQERLLFAPNLPPAATPPPRSAARADGVAAARRLRLGAFGTDSPKKRYPQLLEALARSAYCDRLQLCLYGPPHPYVAALLRDFPANPPLLVDQAGMSLRDFILGLDAVVSVAPGEGFGRPIATALQLGVPCHLIESPVFREFFDGLASFAPDIERLLDGVAAAPARPAPPRRDAGFLAPGYAEAIDAAVRSIDAL